MAETREPGRFDEVEAERDSLLLQIEELKQKDEKFSRLSRNHLTMEQMAEWEENNKNITRLQNKIKEIEKRHFMI